MFQRCVATASASTGATVGREPPSFASAPRASADPAASTVSLKPSSETRLLFISFTPLLFYGGGRRCVILFEGDDVFGLEF